MLFNSYDLNSNVKYRYSLVIINILSAILLLSIANIIIPNNYDDNINYRLAYESIIDLPFNEAYTKYVHAVGGSEPILFIYDYFTVGIMNYEFSVFLINIVFIILFYLVLKKYYKNNYQLIFTFFLLSNFYFLPLLSDIHRLKFAFVFFFLYLITKGNFKILYLILSFSTHFQMLIFGVYKSIVWIINKTRKEKSRFFNIKLLFYLSIIAIIYYFDFFNVYTFLYQNLSSKVGFYLQGFKFNYYTLFTIWFYGLYAMYLYKFKLYDTARTLYMIVILAFMISVVLNFYRLNLIVYGVIYIIEINRLLNGRKYAILPVVSIFSNNIYFTVLFMYKSLNFD